MFYVVFRQIVGFWKSKVALDKRNALSEGRSGSPPHITPKHWGAGGKGIGERIKHDFFIIYYFFIIYCVCFGRCSAVMGLQSFVYRVFFWCCFISMRFTTVQYDNV